MFTQTTTGATTHVYVDSHCSPDLEYVPVKARPMYLPREINVVMVTAVYIVPDANANQTLSKLHEAISNKQNSYPDAVHIVAGTSTTWT